MEQIQLKGYSVSSLKKYRNEFGVYFIEYKPNVYLFKGQYGGQYSSRSAQQVFKNALQKSIKPLAYHNSFRHSYATHGKLY